jgi:hypothetical protein
MQFVFVGDESSGQFDLINKKIEMQQYICIKLESSRVHTQQVHLFDGHVGYSLARSGACSLRAAEATPRPQEGGPPTLVT